MWNKVFNYFMEIKQTIGDKFTVETPLKELVSLYGTEEQIKRIEPLQLTQYGNLVLIRYGMYSNIFSGESELDFIDFWDMYDGFYKECRSLVIDIIAEEIILCPFKKFRNLNEGEENSLENITERIRIAKSIEVSNKLDGSMQSARYYNGKVIMSGSQSLDVNKSWRLTDGYKMLNEKYIKMLMRYPYYTFIFECITLQDAHVVLYNESQVGLYLIGVRNVNTGKQLSYKEVLHIANLYDIPTTKVYNKTFEEVLEDVKKYKAHDKEGFVLNIDGYMVKIKCDDYVDMHRILSNISSPNLIVRKIADGEYDDFISKVPNAYKDRVLKTSNTVFNYIKNTDSIVKEMYKNADKTNLKSFMIWVDKNVEKEYKGYVRNIYLKKDINYLKSGMGYKKFKDLEKKGE